MDVFSPFRPQSNYGSPGYGMYPGRPGTYMNGLGDVVMEPGRDYGAWGYSASGGQHTPRGSWGYGIYGLGNEPVTPPATGGAELEYGARLALGFGVPVVTGLVGISVGLLAGYFVWGR